MAEKGALFDLDGVLIDSSPFHFASWVKLGEEVGFTMTPELFRQTFGQRNDAILRRFFPDATDEQIDMERAQGSPLSATGGREVDAFAGRKGIGASVERGGLSVSHRFFHAPPKHCLRFGANRHGGCL